MLVDLSDLSAPQAQAAYCLQDVHELLVDVIGGHENYVYWKLSLGYSEFTKILVAIEAIDTILTTDVKQLAQPTNLNPDEIAFILDSMRERSFWSGTVSDSIYKSIVSKLTGGQ